MPPPKDPTEGLCLGPYGVLRGRGLFYGLSTHTVHAQICEVENPVPVMNLNPLGFFRVRRGTVAHPAECGYTLKLNPKPLCVQMFYRR